MSTHERVAWHRPQPVGWVPRFSRMHVRLPGELVTLCNKEVGETLSRVATGECRVCLQRAGRVVE